MLPTPEEWTLDGFLNHFQAVHETMPDHPFCWIIGAGASRSSGIPTGAQLVDWWLEDLYKKHCRDTTIPLEHWATDKNLDIEKFNYGLRNEFYPRIYERRFKGFPQEGYAYLEHVMTGKAKKRGEFGLEEDRPEKIIEPSPGYSILAKILEETTHRVVITTNFDNLVADALQIYTNTYPLVCGHESLAEYVRVAMRRPLICKIHRDLLFSPLNDTRKLRLLHEAWSATLRSLLAEFTPIVIGYGGNDDSLMNRLQSLEFNEIKSRLIWCHYQKHKPSERICHLVSELNGVLVPVPDFDRFMILLGSRLGVTPLDDDLKERQESRLERYKESIMKLETKDLPSLKPALLKTYRRVKDWWTWQLKIDQSESPEEKETAYREALIHCANSAELMGNFAVFLDDIRENYEEAEQYYIKAIELGLNDATYAVNYALFLNKVKKNTEEARRFYQKALEIDSVDVFALSSYAVFLHRENLGNNEAESYYRKALEIDPENADLNGSYALFLCEVRQNKDEAERFYRKAFDKAPVDVLHLVNYAYFLSTHQQNNKEAEQVFKKALKLDPTNANNHLRFADFQCEVLKNLDEAERLYRKAIDLAPQDDEVIEGFAIFLWDYKNDLEEAEKYLRKAIAIAPQEITHGANLAEILVLRARYAEAVLQSEAIISLVKPPDSELKAAMLLTKAVALQLSSMDVSGALKELTQCIKEGIELAKWKFVTLFAGVSNRLTTQKLKIYQLYAEAIKNPEKAIEVLANIQKMQKKEGKSKRKTKKLSVKNKVAKVVKKRKA